MWLQLISIVLSTATLGAGVKLIFMLGRLYERFELLDSRVNRLEERCLGGRLLACQESK